MERDGRGCTTPSPFAPNRARLAGMEDPALARLEAAAKSRAYRRRTEMYRWLRARYAKISALLEELEPPWEVIAAEMAAEGVLGRTGNVPTARGARRVWDCVCRDVARDRSYQLTGVKPARQQPSRAPVTWQPPVARPQLPTPVPEPALARGGVPAQTADPDDPPPGSMAYVRRKLEKMSGR